LTLPEVYAQLGAKKPAHLHHHAGGVSVVSWEMCIDYFLAYRWLKRNSIPKKHRKEFIEMCERYGIEFIFQ